MVKKFKSVISLLLSLTMILSIPCIAASADETNEMIISASSIYAMPGSSADVEISLKNNPGVASLKISIGYDENVLTPEKITYNTQMAGSTQSSPLSDDPLTLIWVNSNEEFNGDAVFATVTFRVVASAESSAEYPINVSFAADNVYGLGEKNVSCTTENGKIVIKNITPGDINNDTKVNNKDVSRIMQYLAHWDVDVNEAVLDTNGDGKVNNKDVSRLMQYLAHWNVELHPKAEDIKSEPIEDTCEHKLKRQDEKTPTCSAEGTKAYWYCTQCGKKFLDVNGETEAKNSDLVIPKTDHTIVKDSAVAPTATTEGKTEGSHCSVCGEIIVPQKTIEPSENSITYNIAGENPYLQKQIINNPNPLTYSSSSSLKLKNITCPGYQFLGWYDLPDGDNADIIKEIPAGSAGEVELYAWWKPVTYNIEFSSELIPVEKETYTVEHNHVLPSPSLSGYIFAGWSDDEGQLIKTISEGTTGHKTYYANWISERNQALTEKNIGNPTILEDMEHGSIQYIYKIGEVINVPVSVIQDFGYINQDGIEREVTTEISKTIDKQQMDNYTTAIQKMTTDSYGWTLSDGWSEGVQIDEGYIKETGKTREELEEVARTDSNNWYVSSGQSGSDTTSEINSWDKYGKVVSTKNTQTYDTKESPNKFDAYDLNRIKKKVSSGVSFDGLFTGNFLNPFGDNSEQIEKMNKNYSELNEDEKLLYDKYIDYKIYGGKQRERKISNLISTKKEKASNDSSDFNIGILDIFEIGVGGSEGNEYELAKYKTGTETSENTQKESGLDTHGSTEMTHTSGWNYESGYGGSSSTTQSSSVMNSLTESLSESYNIGKSYISNKEQSSSQGYSTSDAKSDEYASSVTYSLIEQETTTTTFKTANTKTGYHRWIMAGTAHVFGVVGYDIKTSSYYTYTLSIMDDEVQPFEDYSYSDPKFSDNQNTLIPFEIPYDIEEYVMTRVCASDGLEISKDGVVTNYTGKDTLVTIPEYTVQDNRDGTKSVVKVTGLSEKAFKNADDLCGIILSDFITEIPKNAFADKTNLSCVVGYNINSIGDNAFKNCTSLKSFTVGQTVETLGQNAVSGLDKLTIYASNKSVVESAVNSGAKNIVINISDECTDLANTVLSVSEGTETFTFNGMGKTFENVSIESNAAKTIINRANFVSTGKTPLKISSPEIEFNEINTEAPGIALIMSADTTKLSVLGTVGAKADSGKSVVCKDIELEQLDPSITSELDVNGRLLICGEITKGNNYLKPPVIIEKIDETMFENYLNGLFVLTFNANGGTIENDTLTKEVIVGTPYGSMPTPVYDYHTFAGWFTEPENGSQINSDTIFEGSADCTLYAHWLNKNTSDWVLEGDLPSGAKVVAEKWTYDKITRKSSSSSTMDGYTQYDSSWAWSDYGSWSNWQNNAITASDSRQVDTQWITNYKTQYNYSKWTANSNGTGWTGPSKGTWGGYYCGTYVERGWSDSPLSVCDTSQGFNIYGTMNKDPWYNEQTRQVENGGYNQYRYRDRSKVYTYYFLKTEAMESASEITENVNTSVPSESITNVQKWVRYVNK